MLARSVAEGSENIGRPIPRETVAKPLLSLDQMLDIYLLLFYPSRKALLKKKQLQALPIPSPAPMTGKDPVSPPPPACASVSGRGFQ